MRITKFLFVIVFSLAVFNAFSQGKGKTEYSGFFDSYYYKGIQNLNFTVNGGSGIVLGDLPIFKPGVGFGVGVNYKLWPHMMFGTEFHYLMFSGEDNQSNRNLAFSSTNLEFLGYARYYLVDDIIRIAADRSRKPKFFKSYIMLGAGLLKYNAVSSFTEPSPPTDTMYLFSEGGSGLGLVIPGALGFSWRISNKVSLITEAGYRYAFNDRLDAISLRGNPKNKDSYIVVDFKIQISPFAPAKKKSKTLAPPEKYEGPKGTDTWKNRKKEEPAKKRNYYEYEEEEELPNEENPDEEQPLEEENPDEQPLEEEEPVEQVPEEELK